MNATDNIKEAAAGRTTRPAPDPEPVVGAEGLRCSYGDFEAVRGVDLAVRPGELFALLGTNGAGKTTVLETLEGHRRPTRGRVRVLGRDPYRDRRALAGRLGVLFQESALPDELTPAEMLTAWRRLAPPRRGRSGIEPDLERVGLEDRRDVPVGRLSGGERRRLDLAVALSGDPELVFLDEPTTGLDPQARARAWEVVRELLAGGTTVVLTTHYLEEAETLADRLAILHEGRVAVAGGLEEVLGSHPARIRCVLPGGTRPDELPATVGAAQLRSAPGGCALTLRTPSLQRDLAVLLDWADRNRVALRRLQASEPSLAEVFHEVRDVTTLEESR